ncbi:hypothetical protein AM420_005350 [Klebsiella pneumoniae]|nr:hypothetical protein L467_04891 [Klebsiella pneumoniae BIDMC 31]EWD68440.1 hypothetical protein P823_05126 [Klebsiella pneumoniae UCI 20]KDH23792.1 hypothetical protein AE44_05078 [Klebsiella pneumoniae BIDMC 69]KMH46075.1 hypothetical protein SM73_04846 [Klebsiella quasipneumoniae]OKN43302.1 hypothetical protein AM420_005350 [Klebsiella pneumoniae]SXE35587.1 Uncharacterised protein [Klebsiella variicola]VEC46519.1 Uncharacterised protein [Klebsiella aerogenes]
MFILSYTVVEYALMIIIYSTIVYKVQNSEVNNAQYS